VATETHDKIETKRPSVLRFWPLLLLVLAMLLAFALGLHKYLSLEVIVDRREVLKAFVADHWATALAIYALVYVAAVALSLPGGLVLTVLGGFLFGWLVGGIVALVAATVGACGLFLIARTSLGAFLSSRAGPALQRLSRGFQQDAVSYLLFLRLVPLFPFWLVNLAPSLVGVPFRVYALTTLVGIVPATAAFALAGASLDSLVAAQREAYQACLAAGGTDCKMTFSAEALLSSELAVLFVALAVVALIPAVVRRFGGRRFQGLDDRDTVA
jgi:uncharacterized membrane protein YdjX (TVP38/TMEM64 family)